MKRMIFNILLTVILIFALVGSSLLIKNFLPTYKNEIIAHEDYGKGIFQYINATEELNIYPWNIYDERNCNELQNPEIEDSKYAISDLLIIYIENLFPEFIPDNFDEFSNNLYVEQSVDFMYYIQDYTYSDINGRQCNINAVFNFSILEYLRCSYEDIEIITKEDVSNANKTLMNYINNINGWQYKDNSLYFNSNDSYISEEEVENPINSFFAKYLTYLVTPPEYDAWYEPQDFLIYLNDSSAIYYDGYFILDFSVEGSYDSIYTLYIFFDPILDCVVGYSSNPTW